jgi:hypothetical protein
MSSVYLIGIYLLAIFKDEISNTHVTVATGDVIWSLSIQELSISEHSM